MERSKKPLPETLPALMEEHQISLRELVRRTKRQSGWGSPHGISLLRDGHLRPTPEALEHIAQAFQIKPDYFPEWRLAKAREQLDPEKVGLRKALRNLDGG